MNISHESLRTHLPDLVSFAIVAEERSFTRAAARLGVSQSALSHNVRALERRVGLQLLARTTRSVSPTPAGTALLRDLAPSLERIQLSLKQVQQLSDRPSGRLRLVASKSAAATVLMPKLASFTRAYPEIVLDVTVSNDPVDLVAEGFDAGIQIGEFIQKDMIAVRVSPDLKLALVGSPAYFAARSRPQVPQDLKDHACIGFRFSTGMYRWEFEKRRKAVTFNPQGPVSFNDTDLVTQAVLAGLGVGMVMEHSVLPHIRSGALVQLLKDWCPTFPGYFLFYPSRRNQPRVLSALIGTLRRQA